MSISPARWLAVFSCLALLTSSVGGSDAWAAKKKPAKSWPGKKKKGSHKKHAPASGPAKSGGGTAPAEDADEGDDESAQGEDESQSDEKKPAGDDAAKARAKKVAKGDEGEGDEERSSDGDSSDDDEGGSTVVRKKAKHVAEDEDEDSSAPLAFELMAGSRAVHRDFNFHDPLSGYQNGAGLPDPSAYQLKVAPAPFISVGLYPAAFATRGLAASFGIVGSFDKVIGTKTNGETTQAQQFQAGLRFRLPLGAAELGLTGAYGQQLFRISATNPAPMATGVVPNVTYTFGVVGADARFRIAEVVELGLHVGTRLVLDTGGLKAWFPKTKTNSIDAGLSIAYRVTPLIGVVVGADIVRYGFDFNPVPTTNGLVAGGAVDQYISGFGALRVSLAGS
jgi:hypothetical protein